MIQNIFSYLNPRRVCCVVTGGRRPGPRVLVRVRVVERGVRGPVLGVELRGRSHRRSRYRVGPSDEVIRNARRSGGASSCGGRCRCRFNSTIYCSFFFD